MRLLRFVVFHPVQAAIVLILGSALGVASFYAYQVARALDDIAVESFQPDEAREAIEEQGQPSIDIGVGGTIGPDEIPEPDRDPRAELPNAWGDPIPDEVFEAYLMVGADASGALADAIILALQPADGGRPILVSLPRDLYVWNLCKESYSRLNEGLGGCRGVASSLEMMAIMVEDYTGIPVDHVARIDFDGFARVIDLMGGIEACFDNPMRDFNSGLQIDTPGCRTLDGYTTLAWVRSRKGQELVDGNWRPVSGSDFTRQSRQQDVLFQLGARLARFQSPGNLVNRLAAVSRSVRLDSGWSFTDAVSTAWRYRGIRKADVVRFSVDVANMRSPQGASVLRPEKKFTDHLREVIDLDALVEAHSG